MSEENGQGAISDGPTAKKSRLLRWERLSKEENPASQLIFNYKFINILGKKAFLCYNKKEVVFEKGRGTE